MRIAKLVSTLIALTMLAGCSNTYHGAVSNVRDNFHWLHSEPSHMEKNWGPAPRGYDGQGKIVHPVLKPLPAPEPAPVWNDVGVVEAPTDEGSVTVYADDGTPQPLVGDYGQLMQQLYFEHGSSHIAKGDKRKLVDLGKSLKRNENKVSLTVVGHASQRVDGTQDALRRKEINFEMAQKRANAVANVLRHAGVMPDWIEVVSKGEEEATGNEANDRRADLYSR